MTNKIKKHSTESLKGEYGGETFEKTKGATQKKEAERRKKKKKITQQSVKKVRNMGVKR